LCLSRSNYGHKVYKFSMFFSLLQLYLMLATIKTSEFSTLGRCILKRVRFGKKCTWQINWNDAIIESALRLIRNVIFMLFTCKLCDHSLTLKDTIFIDTWFIFRFYYVHFICNLVGRMSCERSRIRTTNSKNKI
jgi:hypothetical protein